MPTTAHSTDPGRSLRFGPGGRFELRPAECRLLVDGEPAALGGRALDLLLALAARPQQVLSKAELLETVWRGLVVEENNLRVQVNSLRRVLGDEAIATVPGRGYRLSAVVQAEPETPASDAAAPAAAAATAQRPAGAPASAARPLPRLYGREHDLARLAQGLTDEAAGCVTLVGPPGVGKSSLARAAAARWAGPSAWVDLAPLTNNAQVDGAIGRALDAPFDAGSDAFASVRRLLPQAGMPLLLILDNAEHVVERCAEWAASLGGTPGLRLLATSQRPLAVAGEQVLRIEPLAIAGDGPGPRDDAVALLVDRIGAADGRLRIGADALPLLVALCRQLDGLPLALEMAAARVPLMGLRAVHDALAERFALLARGRRDAPKRHRTVHDALAWSYGLLSPAEQRLFRALGVFAGGFTLDLAMALVGDEHFGRWDVVDGLATLAERSLVVVSGDDPPRYRLLETMRAYAQARLAEPGADGSAEADSVRRRHAAVVLALFERGDPPAACLAEMENAREAFGWAREHDLAVAARLSAGVARIIGFTVWRQEVTEWMLALEPAMQASAGRALPLTAQANWWRMLAYVLIVRRDPAARHAAEQAVSLWRREGNRTRLQAALGDLVRAIAEPGPALDEACAELQRSAAEGVGSAADAVRVQGALAQAAYVRGDLNARLACREEELRLARSIGQSDQADAAETNVCAALMDLGRHAEAAARARALVQRLGAAGATETINLPWALYMLGNALVALREFAEARTLVPRLLAAERRFGTRMAWHWIVPFVAAQGRLAAAARLLGYVERMNAPRRDAAGPGEQEAFAEVAAAVEAALGAAAAASLAAAGRELDDAAAEALAAADADPIEN